jgi:hypothetical protein
MAILLSVLIRFNLLTSHPPPNHVCLGSRGMLVFIIWDSQLGSHGMLVFIIWDSQLGSHFERT